MAQRITKNLFGNEMQTQALREAAYESAKSMGQDPKAVVAGLNNFLQLNKALSSRPGSVGGLQPQDILEIGGKTYGADAMRIFGFLPFERAARKIEDAVLGKTLRTFDKILTTPEGAELLTKLAKVPRMSREQFLLLSNFGAQAGQQNAVSLDKK
jgi:hypothetical protein